LTTRTARQKSSATGKTGGPAPRRGGTTARNSKASKTPAPRKKTTPKSSPKKSITRKTPTKQTQTQTVCRLTAPLTHRETVSLVCRYFCEGRQPGEIKDAMLKDHGIRISRETPYRHLAMAARNGWIRFAAPPDLELREELSEKYPWLSGVKVAHTASFDDVALRGAETVVDLLRSVAKRMRKDKIDDEKVAVHVGLAGGHSMRRLVQILAAQLGKPVEGLPDKVVFHALVAGFDLHDPTTDPNSFFTYFVDNPALQVTPEFVGLHAPPFAEPALVPLLKGMDTIDRALKQSRDLDIIVTSATSWSADCGHGRLQTRMQRSPKSMRMLKDAGCRGDMLWQPLGPDGPIEADTEIQAVSLIDLAELPKRIDRGCAVVLVLGPCRNCHLPRGEVLQTILNLDKHLISHLVADSRSVAEMVRNPA